MRKAGSYSGDSRPPAFPFSGLGCIDMDPFRVLLPLGIFGTVFAEWVTSVSQTLGLMSRDEDATRVGVYVVRGIGTLCLILFVVGLVTRAST